MSFAVAMNLYNIREWVYLELYGYNNKTFNVKFDF